MLVDGIRDLEPGHLRLLEELERPAEPSNLEVEWGHERIAAVIGEQPFGRGPPCRARRHTSRKGPYSASVRLQQWWLQDH